MTTPSFAQFGAGEQTLNAPKMPFMQRILALPAYHWLLLAVATLAPLHAGGLPFWLIVGLLISVIMQKPAIKQTLSRLTKNHISLKGLYEIIKLTYWLGGMFVIYFVSFNEKFGVDQAVSFLFLFTTTKVWEIFNKRDAYVLINLSFFVVAAAFLIRQSFVVVLIGLFCLAMLLMAFIIISDENNVTGSGRLRALFMLTLPAVPLLVVLFLFFPRIPPLWSLPMAGETAKTGMSDSMSPGDFSKLSQSTELAFRVEFEGTPPDRQNMYWRGLVFSDFDGTTWQQNEFSANWRDNPKDDYKANAWLIKVDEPPAWAMSAYQGKGQRYNIRLEPTGQKWLFLLEYSRPIGVDLALWSDFTLRDIRAVNQPYRYRAIYHHQGINQPQLDDRTRQMNLQLPTNGNEKSHAFAKELFAKSGGNPVAYIHAIQQYITTQGFSYTLSPPLLKKDRIDEFLFGTKAGFCEHYASSFTFLMRSAGVPSRVVVGYQGGEFGRDGASWEVRQMDAHAWSEVWIEGQGWVRIDPTAFIAPNRIQDGMSVLTEQVGAKMFGEGMVGQWGYQQFRALQTLRRYSDQLGYYWQRNVVGYDRGKQKTSLSQWFNIKSFTEQVWVLVLSSCALVATFVVVSLYRRRKRHHLLDLPLVQLEKRLSKINKTLAKAPHEPYLSWLSRVDSTLNNDEISVSITKLQALYRQGRYGMGDNAKTTAKQLDDLVKTIIGHLRTSI